MSQLAARLHLILPILIPAYSPMVFHRPRVWLSFLDVLTAMAHTPQLEESVCREHFVHSSLHPRRSMSCVDKRFLGKKCKSTLFMDFMSVAIAISVSLILIAGVFFAIGENKTSVKCLLKELFQNMADKWTYPLLTFAYSKIRYTLLTGAGPLSCKRILISWMLLLKQELMISVIVVER